MSAKTAIVTGAARGIGLATTRLFLNEGRQVAMIDRDGDELMKVADKLKNVLPIICDVSQPDQVTAMMARVADEMGRVDALVNNAGVAAFEPLDKTDFAIWREVMETNLDGVFLCSQAAIPLPSKHGGTIVNIASISGLQASTLRVAYGTSKAAVIHLTKQFAAELGQAGVRVNCVAPGPVGAGRARARNSRCILGRNAVEQIRNRR